MFKKISVILVCLSVFLLGCASFGVNVAENNLTPNPDAVYIDQNGVGYQGKLSLGTIIALEVYQFVGSPEDPAMIVDPSGPIYLPLHTDKEGYPKQVYVCIMPGFGVMAYAYKIDGVWYSFQCQDYPDAPTKLAYLLVKDLPEDTIKFLDALERHFFGTSC